MALKVHRCVIIKTIEIILPGLNVKGSRSRWRADSSLVCLSHFIFDLSKLLEPNLTFFVFHFIMR